MRILKLEELTAQRRVADYLRRVVRSRRLSHAYILDGERGMGKRTLAESFAAALLCEKQEAGTQSSCGQCRSCRLIEDRNHPDVIYVTRDGVSPNSSESSGASGKKAKKHLSVEDIREKLVHTADIRPYQSEYKVYIVDDADLMTAQAQNALLKTLEEPPEYVVILLLASNSRLLLETIRSRCVLLSLVYTPDDDLRAIVEKKSTVPEYRLDACIAFAEGNVGKALLLIESDEFEERRLALFNLMGKLDKTGDDRLLAFADGIQDPGEFLDLLLIYFKDVLLYKATGSRDGMVLADHAYHIVAWAETISEIGAGRIPAAIEDARGKLAVNGNRKLVLSNLLFQLKEIRRQER